MADIQHSAITDPQIHEPKGISTASVGTVYAADGAGSGAWTLIDSDNLDMADLATEIQSDLDDGTIDVNGTYFLTTRIDDISTASSVIIPLIDNCTVVGASVVLGGAIATADAAISFLNAAAASMGTAITVPFSGSAKGDQFAFTATGNNTIVGPSWIEVVTDGASDNAVAAYITIELSGVLNP